VTEAARFIRSADHRGGGPIPFASSASASRFGVVVTQKIAAQALPSVARLGGAAVNYAFIEHFQDVGSRHFTVRRLERRYGKTLCVKEYERLPAK